jgi:predicted AlkP superfamily pyrophosphatase or phosphodiesterase
MPDLTPDLSPKLQTYRLPGLDLGANVVYPYYTGYSILNVPSSICNAFDIPEFGFRGLESELFAYLGTGAQRVVLVLMDALSLHRLRAWIDTGKANVWKGLMNGGVLAPLTSIVPSTTSSALTTFWTGRATTQHGITGYEIWLKEYGMVINSILQAPMTFKGDVGSLSKAGFEPEKFLNLPTLGAHMALNNVRAHVFQHYWIINSGLSRMFFRDVEKHGISSAVDLWISVRQLIESHPKDQLYCWVYWGEVDGLSHRYGPDNERARAEFESFSKAFETLFLKELSPDLLEDTLVILTADHGQIPTIKNPDYELRNHSELAQLLHINPTGENRLFFVHPRTGHKEAVRAYIKNTWGDHFSVYDSATALAGGLFGPGDPHPEMNSRLGELLVVAHDDAYLWWGREPNPLFGRHGGMHFQEMLVPFLAKRF